MKYLYLAEPADGRLDADRYVGIVSDVDDDRHSLSVEVGDRVMDSLVVDIGGDHLRAFADERLGRHAAHPAAGAGDQRDFTVESSHLPSPGVQRRGPGPRLALAYRLVRRVAARVAPRAAPPRRRGRRAWGR